ncbi:diguanylate cyclase (GGDEF)-like protein/PAS domain S-box-containing protein [Anoxybacillus mongoliensis]|uniref:Diguanylate cyclase (GGDEF)-like protein/PAS domain S-box-containing protein n=1 Tax=Anoxybacillus mongoliensis TaxID=452565 RepID=A0A7W8JEW7_9BACL|nr:GGDEF domain-containing phosphodiesterase [Anoxybacillus mongoliensis]MBB5355388.1 diguanylate cyclase (GGDEF)-like protein/PAS domain S-box-containing protein [Anoxybacillus mongoliensis]MCX8002366.1 EAL domain-containing protein [Anoxybacillus mongoliensis]
MRQAIAVMAPDGKILGADEHFFRHFYHLHVNRGLLKKFIYDAEHGRMISYEILKEENEQKNVYVQATALCNNEGVLQAIVVTYQHEPFIDMRLTSSLSSIASEFTFILSSDGEITYVSPSAQHVLKCKEEVCNHELFSFVHHDDIPILMEKLHMIYATKEKETTVECRWRTREGHFIWIYMHAQPLLNEKNEIEHVIVVAKDITKWKCCEEALAKLKNFDSLTDIPNRFYFETYVEHMIQQKKPFALCYIDFDKIKWINDRFSYQAGDFFLQEAVRRIQQHLQQEDFFARIGGDEFVIVLHDVNKETIVTRMEHLLQSFVEPFRYKKHVIQSGLSIGVTFFPQDGTDLDTLLKQADQALCYAKERGKGYHFYHPQQNRKTMIEQELPLALLNNQFYLCYQPKVSLDNKAIMGVEALMRWTHPTLGAISPLEFISIAEKNGFIFEITTWVLKEACRQVKQWQAHFPTLKLAVNLSPFLLNRKEFVTHVKNILQETQFPPNYLILEITESGLMENIETGKHILTELKQIGIQVAIDDFGTGFSSLAYIRNLPVSLLKIDRSFIRDITDNSKDATIVDTIIHLAKSLDLQVLAEGVERDEQVSLLQKMDCDFAQGFYFSQSLEAEKLLQWLEQHNQSKEALH